MITIKTTTTTLKKKKKIMTCLPNNSWDNECQCSNIYLRCLWHNSEFNGIDLMSLFEHIWFRIFILFCGFWIVLNFSLEIVRVLPNVWTKNCFYSKIMPNWITWQFGSNFMFVPQTISLRVDVRIQHKILNYALTKPMTQY